MKAIGERIKEQREKQGWTQARLADMLNIKIGTLSGYERDYRQPDLEMLRKIATIFKVSADYLLGRTDDPRPLDEIPITELVPGAMPAGTMVKIPVLGIIRAGQPMYAEQNIVRYEEVSANSVKDGKYFYLLVTGDSMINDMIYPGCQVLVRRQNYVDDGRIAVVLVNGDEATVKRVRYADGKVILVPANPLYKPQIYDEKDVKILGKVTKIELKAD